MKGFNNNLPLNVLSILRNIGKQAKEVLKKEVLNKPSLVEDAAKNIQQTQNIKSQSLNANSNIGTNLSKAISAPINQTVLNTSNEPQINLTANLRPNTKIQSSPSQLEFQGPKDLPSYAGISNMSLKSWIAGKDSKNLASTENGEKQLIATLEGIKGFQRQNYEGFGQDSRGNKDSKELQLNRRKMLLLLSQLFSCREQSQALQETELLINIVNFRKLGSTLKEETSLTQEESTTLKLSPPQPNEFQRLNNIDPLQIKYLYQLLALPSEFPEYLRLFAKDSVEINQNELSSFLTKRLGFVQEQIFGGDRFLNAVVANFAPLLNRNDYSLLLPLLLLYYPLPPPIIKNEDDFSNEWKKKKKNKLNNIIASCEIYFISKLRGRFLLKFELSEEHEFFFDVQASSENNGIVKDLEMAVAESMCFLEHPPLLADLNVLLTEEIYKATDIDEELSIISKGPLRLEIVLAAYASLLVLNKLNQEPDPAGLIEMKD